MNHPKPNPDHTEFIALFSSNRFTELELHLKTTLREASLWGFGWKLLGATYLRLGQPTLAQQALEQAGSLQPADADITYNLGHAYAQCGELDSAIQAFEHAIRLRPNPDTYNCLGNVLTTCGNTMAARTAYRQALDLDPNFPEALNNLGNSLKLSGDIHSAIEVYRKVVELLPHVPEVHCNLGSAHQDMRDMEAALRCFETASALSQRLSYPCGQIPYLMLHCADWSRLESQTQILRQRITTDSAEEIPSFNLLALPGIGRDEQLACARQEATHSYAHLLSRPPLTKTVGNTPSGRLRIGYLSSDFHAHATSWLLLGVLEAHDRDRYEIHAYSYGPDDGSPTRQRVKAACECFHEVRNLPHDDIARLIAASRIDILVDLKGFTQGARPEILAMRPAPIQVNWLGYPGSLGHERLADYLIGDPVVTPLDHVASYSEKLALMPHCYQPTDNHRRTGPRPERIEAGLPENGLIFCSFNQTYKINPSVMDAWCHILRAVPHSCLWLLEPTTEIAKVNLLREAVNREIGPERLIFAPSLEQEAHLGRLQLADIALDTFPYTSHTTGSDALWCGVPLITLMGESFPSRVAASLLHATGLPELVTESWDGYVKLATALALDPSQLGTIRQRLANHRNSCPLFDTTGFAHDIERLYDCMWQQHLTGETRAIVLAPVVQLCNSPL